MASRKDKTNAVKQANIKERQHKAFELRKNGMAYQTIADTLGYSYSTIRNDIVEVLEVLKKETLDEAKEYRSLQVNRLMDILHTHRPIAMDSAHEDYHKATDIVLKTETMLMKLMGTEELPVQKVETNAVQAIQIDYSGIPDEGKGGS